MRSPGFRKPRSIKVPKRDTWERFLRLLDFKVFSRNRFNFGQARTRMLDVRLVALNADILTSQRFGDRRGGAQCRRMDLARCRPDVWRPAGHGAAALRASASDGLSFHRLPFQTLSAGAQRDCPVRAHLLVAIEDFQSVIVKRDFGFLVLARPDQRFMCVLETCAFEIRHRIGLEPDDIILNPEAGNPAGSCRRGRCYDTIQSPRSRHYPSGSGGIRSANGG